MLCHVISDSRRNCDIKAYVLVHTNMIGSATELSKPRWVSVQEMKLIMNGYRLYYLYIYTHIHIYIYVILNAHTSQLENHLFQGISSVIATVSDGVRRCPLSQAPSVQVPATNIGDWLPKHAKALEKNRWCLVISDVYVYTIIYIYTLYIYTHYIYIWSRPRSLHPPNGLGPQVAPPSLLFASFWQHFWGPASFLLGLCSISDYQPRIY